MRTQLIVPMILVCLAGVVFGSVVTGMSVWLIMRKGEPTAEQRNEAGGKGTPGLPVPEPGKKMGENWLYTDLQKHFEKQGPPLRKVESWKITNRMYFYTASAKYDPKAVVYTAEALHFDGWDADWLAVEKHNSYANANQAAITLRDEKGEKAFAWGKYVFRGPPATLDRVRKLLPKDGF